MSTSTDNSRIAERLLEAARLLDARRASPYRAAAFRAAGQAVVRERRDLRAVFAAGGVKALDGIPHVGLGIASAIAQMLREDRWTELERLRGEADPETLFQGVPGVGRGLARRIRDELHVQSLQALEAAANDGRLEHVPGFGPRRAAAIRGSLDHMLHARESP